eukprot:13309018-Alexandrium_andersonii.AAC.1
MVGRPSSASLPPPPDASELARVLFDGFLCTTMPAKPEALIQLSLDPQSCMEAVDGPALERYFDPVFAVLS